MRVKLKILVVCLSVLLGACAVGPDYQKPQAWEHVELKQAPEGWKFATPKDDQFKGDWWAIFGDEQLNELVLKLNQNNQTLQASYANFRVAEASLRVSKAGLFPKLGASSSAQRSSSNVSVVGGNKVDVINENKSVSLDMSWEVDLWGRLRRSVEASDAQLAGSAADLANVRLSLQANLMQAYVSWQLNQRLLGYTQYSVYAYERSLTVAENRFKQGLSTKADVFAAQAQLSAMKSSMLEYELSAKQSEHAIAALVGIPPANLVLRLTPSMRVPPLPDAFTSDLLERRPDVASAERKVASANAQIGVAKAAFFPSLTINASGGSTAKKIADLFTSPAEVWSLGASVLVTIFDAGARSAQIDVAKAQYEAAVANYKQTVLTGLQEVEDGLLGLQQLSKEKTQQDFSLASAQEARRVAKANFELGMTDYTSFASLESAYWQSLGATEQLEARRLSTYISLVTALGGAWEGAGPSEF